MAVENSCVGANLVAMMLRSWSSARRAGDNPLPAMHAKSARLAASLELVFACDSLFALTEALLERPLVPECCCSTRHSPDEAALIALIEHAPHVGLVGASEFVPHGLPGVMRWAVMSVRRALGDDEARQAAGSDAQPPERCPFIVPQVRIAA